MKVHRDINNLPTFRNAVVTLGTFDGVHTGHRILIENIIEISKHYDKHSAGSLGGESVLLTFDIHPRTIVKPGETEPKMLTTLDEKIELLEQLGVDHLVIIPFTKSFSQLSAREYVSDFLVKHFHPSVIVIGYNHRFGHHRDGNIELLQKLSAQFGFEVKEINKQLVNDISVSSSRIRIALEEGDIATANELLGYNYMLHGVVVHGDKRGKSIGFPTANIQPNHANKLIPIRGVYAVRVIVYGNEYKAMLNIGIRPTVRGTLETIEAHILNFDKDIYDQSITIKFYKRLRDEKKFSGIEALKEQLGKDQKEAEHFFSLSS